MGASVSHEFDKGFYLDEERLRKINSIISERLKQVDNDFSPTFQLHRQDNYTYSTNDINDIIEEENSDYKKITTLNIKFEERLDEQDVPLKISLKFDKSSCFFEMEGDDRDYIYLFYSDLREYISNEVCKIRRIFRKTVKNILLYISLIGMISITILMMLSLQQKDELSITTEIALESKEIMTKIDHLIELSSQNSSLRETNPYIGVMLFSVILILLATISSGIVSIIYKLRPNSIFLFGKEIGREETRKKWRERLIWGIGLAFFLGLLVEFLGKRLFTQ